MRRKRSYFIIIKIKHRGWRLTLPIPLLFASCILRISSFFFLRANKERFSEEELFEYKEGIRALRKIMKRLRAHPPFIMIDVHQLEDHIQIKTF